MEDVRPWFQTRSYTEHIVQREMKKFQFTNVNRVKKLKETKGVTLAFMHHPLLKSLQSLINPFVPNTPFLLPLKASAGRERVHWEQNRLISILAFYT